MQTIAIMKVLGVLFTAFIVSLLVSRLATGDWHLILSGNIAMCAMLVFTGIAHFIYTRGMVMMIPDMLPMKKEAVYLTGIIEIAAGIALLFPAYRYYTAIGIIIFLILIFPANIYTAMKRVDFTKATYEGNGLSYLWFRVPMQLFLIAWVWYFGMYLA